MADRGLKTVLAVSFQGMSESASREAGRILLHSILEYGGGEGGPWGPAVRHFLNRSVGEGGPWGPAVRHFLNRSVGQAWLFFKPHYCISMCDSGHPDQFFHPTGYIKCTPQEVLDILVGYNNF